MKRLDPKAVWLFFFNFDFRTFIPIIFIAIYSSIILSDFGEGLESGGVISFGFLNWLWIIIPALLALCFIWAKLTYHFYRYELTEAGFRKELGVIYKKYVTIPYDRIQNVDINRGILDRLLGLSSLKIQTAGASSVVNPWVRGATAEGLLPGLSREVAEQLRDELIARARQSKNQGL